MERGVGMELSNGFVGSKEGFREFLTRNKGQIPAAPDGPLLPCFSALELAQAIEAELQRGAGCGQTKIQLNMNFKDAADMASYLRRAALSGV